MRECARDDFPAFSETVTLALDLRLWWWTMGDSNPQPPPWQRLIGATFITSRGRPRNKYGTAEDIDSPLNSDKVV